MYPRITSKMVSSDVISFRRKHYWIGAPKKYKHLRRPHEHNFTVRLSVSVKGNDREIPCEFLNHILKISFYKIPDYFPWSCETLAKKIMQKVCTYSKDLKQYEYREAYDFLIDKEFLIEVNEGNRDQGAAIGGRLEN